MSLTSKILSFLMLSLILLLTVPVLADSDCDGCKRAGKLEDCTADDPMGIAVSKGSDNAEPSGDMWKDVTQPSGNYYSGLKAFCSSMKTLLNELFLPECFGILGTEKVEALRKKAEELGWPEAVIPRNYKQPEYSFEIDFVSGLDEYRESDGRPVRSRMKVTMFFDGDEREEIHQWNTVGTWDLPSDGGTTLNGHHNKLRHAYRDGPSITEIIDDFEKRPDNCQMKLEEEVVKLGQIIEIELSDFKDVMGETSREFNRVMLQVLHGKILNGMPSKYSDGLRIFPIGDEPIKIKYQAPDSCEVSVDSLIINSTCDILDEDREPYADTELDEQIQSKAIPLFCPGVYVIMTATHKKSNQWDKEERGKIDRKDWDQTTSLTVRVDFDKEPVLVRQAFDMTTMTSAPDRYRYKPTKWTISSPQHSGSGSSLQKVEGSRGLEYMLESSSNEIGNFTNLRPRQSGIMLTIDVDPATGKARQVSVPAYEADLTMTTTNKCTKKEKRTVEGREQMMTEDCSDSWKHESTFLVGHGEDECWKIQGGDGISSITGECRRRINNDNGYEEMEFRWSITIRNESK